LKSLWSNLGEAPAKGPKEARAFLPTLDFTIFLEIRPAVDISYTIHQKA
jgi:hypothetical protein